MTCVSVVDLDVSGPVVPVWSAELDPEAAACVPLSGAGTAEDLVLGVVNGSTGVRTVRVEFEGLSVCGHWAS